MSDALVKKRAAYENGINAENIACAYLQGKEFQIIEQRYKTQYGEIDILAYDGKTLVAIEVKSRESLDDALSAITPKAQRRIQEALLSYVAAHDLGLDTDMRFDVVAVDKRFQIHHLDNAWQAQA